MSAPVTFQPDLSINNKDIIAQLNSSTREEIPNQFYNNFYLPELENARKVFSDQSNDNVSSGFQSRPSQVRNTDVSPASQESLSDYYNEKYVAQNKPFYTGKGALNGSVFMKADKVSYSKEDNAFLLHGTLHRNGLKPAKGVVKIMYHHHERLNHNTYATKTSDRSFALQQAKEINAILFDTDRSDSTVSTMAQPPQNDFLNMSSNQNDFNRQDRPNGEPKMLKLYNISKNKEYSDFIYFKEGRLYTKYGAPIYEKYDIIKIEEVIDE